MLQKEATFFRGSRYFIVLIVITAICSNSVIYVVAMQTVFTQFYFDTNISKLSVFDLTLIHWGLCCPIGRLQCIRGEQQGDLEEHDWEERPPGSEPERCFVVGLLCKPQFGHNEHHVLT